MPLFVLLAEPLNQDPLPKCVRRNFEIQGFDIVDSKSLPDTESSSLRGCQDMCNMILGCAYFSWHQPDEENKPKCSMKYHDATESWKLGSTIPHMNIYTGPAKCGT